MLKTVSSVINAIGALNYQGTWNASANSPALASGVGTKGDYYVVSVAGSTNLDGITDWQIGDWAVFNGTVWQKIDNTDGVVSVNGQTGVVVLTAANVGAAANTVNVLAGTGLSGGGALTGNVTLNLANTAVSAGNYGNASTVGSFTADAQGRITAASNVTISIAASQINSSIPNSGLANSTATIGNTTVTLGGTSTSLGNLTLNNATTNGLTKALVTKTGNYTATTVDCTILGNAATGNITITLPTAASVAGRFYVVKKIDSTANTVTVATTSAQTIDGQSSKVLSIQYDGIQVQSDNANWVIISNTFGRNGTAGSF